MVSIAAILTKKFTLTLQGTPVTLRFMIRPLIWGSLTLLTLAAVDYPRLHVPPAWQAPLSLQNDGDFRIEKQGDITLKYVTARLQAGGLEVMAVPSLVSASARVRSVNDIAAHFSDATRRTVLAAVNGGFFDMATGLPVGFLLRDGEMDFFNMPQGVTRSMVGLGDAIQIVSPKTMPKVWLETPRIRMGVHHINVPGGKNAFGVFTARYPAPLIPPPGSIYLLAEREGRTAQRYRVKSRLPTGSFRITPNHIVIALRGHSVAYASAMKPGNVVRLSWSLPSSWQDRRISHGLLAGPRLLKNGTLRVTAVEERLSNLKSADRVALGVKANGDAILLWAHRAGSGNLTYEELASLLKERGAVEAIGLDGGRSRAILAQSPAPYFEGGRPVANALVVVKKI